MLCALVSITSLLTFISFPFPFHLSLFLLHAYLPSPTFSLVEYYLLSHVLFPCSTIFPSSSFCMHTSLLPPPPYFPFTPSRLLASTILILFPPPPLNIPEPCVGIIDGFSAIRVQMLLLHFLQPQPIEHPPTRSQSYRKGDKAFVLQFFKFNLFIFIIK